jgi:hypothetical protein
LSGRNVKFLTDTGAKDADQMAGVFAREGSAIS